MQQPLAIALLDIDYFKIVNDRYSHQVGDLVLQRVARIIGAAGRSQDLVARYGGEEFFLGLSETTIDEALDLCESVRLAVAEYPWKHIAAGLGVTVSIGISDDLKAASCEHMLASADSQLYRAKNEGRNRVCMLDSAESVVIDR